MRFGVLGPLLVSTGSGEVAIARRERILLALLLLHANRTVSVDRVVDAIWGERPPADSTGQVHATVYRLRKGLAAAGGSRETIITEPAGYRARVDPQQLDLAQFRELRAQARAAAGGGDPGQGRELYRTALELWRGNALAGVDSDAVRYAAAGLDEEYLQAIEECLEVELAQGRSGEIVAELTELVGRHPHREGLHRTLMLALYRAGRQADALAAYRHARTLLRDELGLEPGPELQRLHQAILNRDPEVDPPTPAQPTPAQPAPSPGAELGPADSGRSLVPRELPADVAGFTGRGDALKALDGLLAGAVDGGARPVVISAIAGTAGIGKTALAVHWAHQVAGRFPDGQLYVNLRGYDPEQPMAPADALARFLGALGVAGQDIPLELAERAARYRSEVAQRRMLVVLDNAATAEQVRPLLPGAGSCTVVVTSRDSLAGLVAVDGARRLDLDLLPPGDAVALLRRLIGDRVDAEPDAAATLADLCSRLPLALRVAAELAASRPAVPLADLVAELADGQRRLELLDGGGDPYASVQAVFSWSVRHLAPEVARMFRLLGLHPGPDFDAYGAAALTDTTLERATLALGQLARAHLVHPTAPSRCAMHDLLRAYATQLVTDQDPDTDRNTALTRLFDYYLATTAAAMAKIRPAAIQAVDLNSFPAPLPHLSGYGKAQAWLDAERATLISLVAYGAAHDHRTHAIRLSSILFRYLDGSHNVDAMTVHRHAYQAALGMGDLVQQAKALRYVGAAYGRMGRFGLAARQYRRSLDLFRQVGDRDGTARVLTSLGSIEERLGRYDEAIEYHEEAIALFRDVGDRAGEAFAVTNLGMVDERIGNYEQAANKHRNALVLFQELDHLVGVAGTLDNLGNLRLVLGRPEDAAEHFSQALVHFRALGERTGESWVLNGLGEAAMMSGRVDVATGQHIDALAVAREVGALDQQARAHAGLGRAHRARGDHVRAREHYQQAVAIYTELEVPEAEEVRERLAEVEAQADGSTGGAAGEVPGG